MVKQKLEIKELRPKNLDIKHIGSEPNFSADDGDAPTSLVKAFNWYNYFYDGKDAREFLCQYLDYANRVSDSKLLRRINDRHISSTYGWLARCVLRGYKMSEHENQKLETEIQRLISKLEPEIVSSLPVSNNRRNVQEIMREKAHEAGGELEGMWDDYLKSGAKKENNISVVSVLTQYNILPQHINILTDAWKNKLDEYVELQTGKDEQLNEAYAHYGKIQVRNIINTIETVIAELNSYINIKKTGRKPRAKKPVSVEKVVKRLKYLKSFKLEKLELESVSPTKLHGCSEAWVYDTKKRKLHHYVADEYSKSLSVKGNTVIGFCTKQSEVKTLRKPETQIKEIMGSKPAARKFFKDIKAVSVTPNGRFNAEMIILKAF